MIYDMDNVGIKETSSRIRKLFYEHAHVKDQRVINMLLERGYQDLEDTMLQHKQKNHLMLLLEGRTNTDFNSKRLSANASEEEQFARWL